MTRPEIDSPEACEMCRGSGAVAYGPWGARPPKKTCPECGGNGWRDGIDLGAKRLKAVALIEAGEFAMRSCHKCNAAHEHFTNDEDCVILCFVCGHYWLGGVDITQPEEPDPKPVGGL